MNNKAVIEKLRQTLLKLEAEKTAFNASIADKINGVNSTINILMAEDQENENIARLITSNVTTVTTASGTFKTAIETAIESFDKAAQIIQMQDTLINTVRATVNEDLKKFETSATIARLICKKYGMVKDEAQMDKFITQVSSLLSLWKRRDEIASYQFTNSKKDNVWGRIDWLYNGKPKEGFFEAPFKKYTFNFNE